MCVVTYLMKVWKIVQRAVFDRAAAVPSVKLSLWEAGGGAGRKLLDGAETLQRVVLMEAACVVLSVSAAPPGSAESAGGPGF